MIIIEGDRVDLVEPFPTNQLGRLWGWAKAMKSIAVLDGSPQTEEEFIEYMNSALPYIRSFGVIDKYNEINAKHEAPMVGFIMLQPNAPCSMYFHVASSRRVWGSGLLNEAALLSFNNVFETEPGLQRISAFAPATNKAARGFYKNIGMHKDGYFKNAGIIKGHPISMAHYGYIRPVASEINYNRMETT